MSTALRTRDYAVELAESALDAFSKQARGTLEAPNGDENVRLYTAKGGSAVTLGSTTTSAAVVFDPESSLRNGQMGVVVYERNAADTVTKVSNINLGKASQDFLSVGVLSSGLKVFNSSGVDVIGGTQSSAVLTSVPRDISSISTTDLSNFTSNHERDLASGVVSRDDATMTMVMTDHFGSKMCLARSNTKANVVSRTWDDSVGSRRTTAGQSLGPIVDLTTTVDFAGTAAATASTASFLSADASVVLDSKRLSEANNPLTLATYSASVTGYLNMASAGVTTGIFQAGFRIVALDAADVEIATAKVVDATTVDSAANASFDLVFRAAIKSDTVPIARVVAILESINHGASSAPTQKILAASSVFELTAFEETADIPARPIHVCVLEGLNASATVNINSTALLTGVPDSGNVFIGAGSPKDAFAVDRNAVDLFLRSLIRVMPRAFTIAGHGTMTYGLKAMYGDEELEVSFKAMSFGSFVDKVHKVGAYSKKIGKELLPAAEALSAALGSMPGPAGVAGRALGAGTMVAKPFLSAARGMIE